jgi:chromosome segregation ATPase
MSLGPRAIWQKASTSVAHEVTDELRAAFEQLSGPLSAIEGELRSLKDEMATVKEELRLTRERLQIAHDELQSVKAELAGLRRAVANDFSVANELSILQGRHIRSVEDRLESLEEQVSSD